MFYGATAFNQPLGTWNTTGVTSMDSMFYGAAAFNQPIGTWNTSGVKDMGYMFYEADSLQPAHWQLEHFEGHGHGQHVLWCWGLLPEYQCLERAPAGSGVSSLPFALCVVPGHVHLVASAYAGGCCFGCAAGLPCLPTCPQSPPKSCS